MKVFFSEEVTMVLIAGNKETLFFSSSFYQKAAAGEATAELPRCSPGYQQNLKTAG